MKNGKEFVAKIITSPELKIMNGWILMHYLQGKWNAQNKNISKTMTVKNYIPISHMFGTQSRLPLIPFTFFTYTQQNNSLNGLLLKHTKKLYNHIELIMTYGGGNPNTENTWNSIKTAKKWVYYSRIYKILRYSYSYLMHTPTHIFGVTA